MAKKRAEIEARLGRRPEPAEQASIDRFMTSSTGDVQASNLDLKAIRLDRIVPDPDQPRRTMSEDSLAELAASIREQGVIQPIEVDYDPQQDVYVLVHGERRWKAAQMAGLSTIPAIIKPSPLDRATRLVRQLIENIQREDLNDVDRARALVSLRDQMQEERDARLAADELDDSAKATWKTRFTWAEVGERVGLSRARMSQLRALLDLPDVIRDDVRQGVLTEYDTRAYRGLAADQQRDLHRAWREQGLTSAEVKEAATVLKAEAKAPDPRSVDEVVALVTAPPPPPPLRPEPVEGRLERREEAVRPVPVVEARPALRPEPVEGPPPVVEAPSRWLADLGHLHATLNEISRAGQLTDDVVDLLQKIQSLVQEILARSNTEG
jgi:ParB family chromosome partitioning protein